MEPETTPSRNKKIFKIALGVFAAIAVLLSVAYVLTARKNARQAEAPVITPVKKEYTQEEKLQILAHIAQEALKDTPPQAEKLRTLQTLAKQTPKSSASTTEKLNILQALATKSSQ